MAKEKVLSINEVAALTGYAYNWVHRLAIEGELVGTQKMNGRWEFKNSDVQAFITARKAMRARKTATA